jgi:hypothetical protein
MTYATVFETDCCRLSALAFLRVFTREILQRRRRSCRLPTSFEHLRWCACAGPRKAASKERRKYCSTWQNTGCEPLVRPKEARWCGLMISRRSCRKMHSKSTSEGHALTNRCSQCGDTGWVCEVHPDKPWSGVPSELACYCGAQGAPCELCNPDAPPDILSGVFHIAQMPGDQKRWH